MYVICLCTCSRLSIHYCGHQMRLEHTRIPAVRPPLGRKAAPWCSVLSTNYGEKWGYVILQLKLEIPVVNDCKWGYHSKTWVSYWLIIGISGKCKNSIMFTRTTAPKHVKKQHQTWRSHWQLVIIWFQQKSDRRWSPNPNVDHAIPTVIDMCM